MSYQIRNNNFGKKQKQKKTKKNKKKTKTKKNKKKQKKTKKKQKKQKQKQRKNVQCGILHLGHNWHINPLPRHLINWKLLLVGNYY